MKQLFYIAIGGSIGAIMRYVSVSLVHLIAGKHFPLGTLFVNIIGSFILGFVSIFFIEQMVISVALRSGITIGLLGAFTTFSTFSVDTVSLLESGQLLMASINILASVFCCLLAAWIGIYLGRQF